MRKRLGVRPAVALPVASVAPLAVAAVTPRGKRRYIAVGAAYMWVFKVSWEMPYDDPDQLRGRLQVDYPIWIDSLIGGGMPPTQRLQRALRDRTRVTALDRGVTVIYGSWVVPHLVLAWVLFHHEQFIPRATGRLAAAYHLTTPFYWLVPTAPPWWASEKGGEMGGEVERVVPQVLSTLTGRPRKHEGETKGNPWGSMPSDVVPAAAVTARSLAQLSQAAGMSAWACTALLALTVVYLGEHYVVDVIAGLVLSEAVWRAEPVMLPLVRLGLDILHELDRLVNASR
ncbi:MAG: phosphatase PAP2 family protein [Actinomycetota bacterium]|nr:phosphatase PAP2 family protein [Actinomycetota bacterium]